MYRDNTQSAKCRPLRPIKWQIRTTYGYRLKSVSAGFGCGQGWTPALWRWSGICGFSAIQMPNINLFYRPGLIWPKKQVTWLLYTQLTTLFRTQETTILLSVSMCLSVSLSLFLSECECLCVCVCVLLTLWSLVWLWWLATIANSYLAGKCVFATELHFASVSPHESRSSPVQPNQSNSDCFTGGRTN